MSPSRKDIEGIECDWLGVDAVGHVGYFTTAGGGYAPAGFLDDVGLHERAIDALWALPPCTRGRSRSVPERCVNVWRLAMERGLYGFDSHPHGGDYKRCAIPKQAVRVADLPEVVQAAALLVRIPIEFRRSCRVRDRHFTEL